MARLVGRPSITPSGSVDKVVEYATWLKGLLREAPRIRYEDVASQLGGRRGKAVYKSTICRELAGKNTPSEDLEEVILELRELDPAHYAERAQILEYAYELREASLIAERGEIWGARRRSVSGISGHSDPSASYSPVVRSVTRPESSAAPLTISKVIAAFERAQARADDELKRSHADLDRVRRDAAIRAADSAREAERQRDEIDQLSRRNADLLAEIGSRRAEIMGLRVELQAERERPGSALADQARIEREALSALQAADEQRRLALTARSTAEEEIAAIKEKVRVARIEAERMNIEIDVLTSHRERAVRELEQLRATLDELQMLTSESNYYRDYDVYPAGETENALRRQAEDERDLDRGDEVREIDTPIYQQLVSRLRSEGDVAPETVTPDDVPSST